MRWNQSSGKKKGQNTQQHCATTETNSPQVFGIKFGKSGLSLTWGKKTSETVLLSHVSHVLTGADAFKSKDVRINDEVCFCLVVSTLKPGAASRTAVGLAASSMDQRDTFVRCFTRLAEQERERSEMLETGASGSS